VLASDQGPSSRAESGYGGYLRTGLLDGPAASVSLPLDVGAATETIPAHLRRAVIARVDQATPAGNLPDRDRQRGEAADVPDRRSLRPAG
jgi:hypothetical protein